MAFKLTNPKKLEKEFKDKTPQLLLKLSREIKKNGISEEITTINFVKEIRHKFVPVQCHFLLAGETSTGKILLEYLESEKITSEA